MRHEARKIDREQVRHEPTEDGVGPGEQRAEYHEQR